MFSVEQDFPVSIVTPEMKAITGYFGWLVQIQFISGYFGSKGG